MLPLLFGEIIFGGHLLALSLLGLTLPTLRFYLWLIYPPHNILPLICAGHRPKG